MPKKKPYARSISVPATVAFRERAVVIVPLQAAQDNCTRKTAQGIKYTVLRVPGVQGHDCRLRLDTDDDEDAA